MESHQTTLPPCLTPDCQRPSNKRGLCNACYEKMRRHLKAGRTTEAKLIRAKKVLPAYSKSRSQSHFLKRKK